MKSEEKCSCVENHQRHICELIRTGQIESLEQYTDDPIVSCRRCLSEANYSDYVCKPLPLFHAAGN